MAGLLPEKRGHAWVLGNLRFFVCLSVQALNVLGETAWKINKAVLEVVEKLWEAGGGVADLVEGRDVSFRCFHRPVISRSLCNWRSSS